MKEREELINTQWLTDAHSSAAQKLLKKQFPNVDGLYSPLVGTSIIGFDSVTNSNVQIHNANSSHWVMSTAGILSMICVDVFDSLAGDTLAISLRRPLTDTVCMYKTLVDEDGAVKVIIKPVQQQRTRKGNCGPFAIAFAATVCSGLDPSACAFSERALRRHIREGFETGTIRPFPQGPTSMKRAKEVKPYVSIHCNCYEHISVSEMVRCNGCQRWYHFNCINCRGKAREKILQQETWYCHYYTSSH